mmetsp:Transcript_11628/g.18655  ORF Transcript_11628/g.18655 Transcript_11628/m.18655 type:complete len:85 (-) Transcript_11628:1330-1584(-)
MHYIYILLYHLPYRIQQHSLFPNKHLERRFLKDSSTLGELESGNVIGPKRLLKTETPKLRRESIQRQMHEYSTCFAISVSFLSP